MSWHVMARTAVGIRAPVRAGSALRVHVARQAPRRVLVKAAAKAPKVDSATGVSFPATSRFGDSANMACLGVGHRAKKIAFIEVKVYAVAVFADADKAVADAAERARSGGLDTDDACAEAFLSGQYDKVLQLELVRDVDGETFGDAIRKSLEAPVTAMGEASALEEFKAFFLGRKLSRGTNVVLRWRPEGALEVSVEPGQVDWSSVKAGLRISSAGMSRALFGVFVGSGTTVPEARRAAVAGIRALTAGALA